MKVKTKVHAGGLIRGC